MDGMFYAKLPQGESPYDVAIRVRVFLETIFRDKLHGIDPLFSDTWIIFIIVQNGLIVNLI